MKKYTHEEIMNQSHKEDKKYRMIKYKIEEEMNKRNEKRKKFAEFTAKQDAKIKNRRSKIAKIILEGRKNNRLPLFLIKAHQKERQEEMRNLLTEACLVEVQICKKLIEKIDNRVIKIDINTE